MLTVPPAPKVEFRYAAVPDGLEPSDLFGVARRINPRRSALFVSRVLGKHIPVDPAICLFTGLHLSGQVGAQPESWPSLAAGLSTPEVARSAVDAALMGPMLAGPPVHVIGCAETATALGHTVSTGLPGSDYVHTTRRIEAGWEPVISFSEEHSHAVHHRLVHRNPRYLRDDHPVVFVDDELTTGRTLLNAIAAIQARFPRPRYLVASLLDLRDAAARIAFREAENRLATTITVVSLVAGEASVVDELAEHACDDQKPASHGDTVPARHHVVFGGVVARHHVDFGGVVARRGWDTVDQTAFESSIGEVAGKLRAARNGPRALVLGTEEFMYAPLRAALAMGDGVVYQSTTRSPIVVADVDGYPVRRMANFANPSAPGLTSFVYNLAPGAYDDIFVIFEEEHREADVEGLVAALSGAGPAAVHLVFAHS